MFFRYSREDSGVILPRDTIARQQGARTGAKKTKTQSFYFCVFVFYDLTFKRLSSLLSISNHGFIRRDINLNATILSATGSGAVVGNRNVVGQTLSSHTIACNAVTCQIVGNSLSSLARQFFVCCATSRIIGVSVNGNIRIGIVSQRIGKLRQRIFGRRDKVGPYK